jgi:aminoglycoside 6-adenylyltransferase
MQNHLANDPIIRKLQAFAATRDDVAAMLMTSTRAIPGGQVDALSDYDIILVVRDITPFADDHSWIGEFGDVLVAYWDPIEHDPDTGENWTGNIVQYADGLKIDFTLWPVEQLTAIAEMDALPAELDAGYVVIADNHSLTAKLSPPSYRAYIPAKPDLETYLKNVNDFFIGVPYVAKCLLREELLPAKWCLDYDMRDVYLRPMLEWRMEIDHDWSVSTGNLGKGLKRRLPAELWAELEATYAAAGIEENWESLFRLIAFYGRIAREVGASLGYTYPGEFHDRVTAFARAMRSSSPD